MKSLLICGSLQDHSEDLTSGVSMDARHDSHWLLTGFDLSPQFLRNCAVSKMALQTGFMWFAGKVKKYDQKFQSAVSAFLDRSSRYSGAVPSLNFKRQNLSPQAKFRAPSYHSASRG
jgi:hypothetical protein